MTRTNKPPSLKNPSKPVKSSVPAQRPKTIYISPDLPKFRLGKIMRRIMRKIVAGEGDQLSGLGTVAELSIADVINQKVAGSA